jgi:hypothetical protein
MKCARATMVLLAMFALTGCPKPDNTNSSSSSSSSGSSSGPGVGFEGGRCSATSTCNTGLICQTGVCVRGLDGGMGSSGGVSSGGGNSSSIASSGSSGAPVFVPGGAEAPCTVVAVNRAAPGSGPVHTGDAVELAPPLGVAAPVVWRSVRAPYGSRTVLVPHGTAGNVILTANGTTPSATDVPGYFVFEAAHAADGGVTGGVVCSLTVVPSAGLYVVANWANGADVDLHLLRRDSMGRYCEDTATADSSAAAVEIRNTCMDNNANACFFTTCKDMVATPIDWDGVAGVGAGDPVLLQDGQEHGPEVIHVPTPGAGDYLAAVDIYTLHGLPAPTIRVQVYLAGWLRGEYTVANASTLLLPVAVIHVPPTGDTCVSDARDASAVASCAGLPACSSSPCSQCSDDTACGPGTRCNTATHLCQGFAFQPCAGVGGCGTLSCIPAYGECATNLCSCGLGTVCDESINACSPKQPVCNETDEPNNVLAMALPFNQTSAPAILESALCPGDVDVTSFNASAPGTLTVWLTALPEGSYTHNHATVDIRQGGARVGVGVEVGNKAATAHVEAGPVEIRVAAPFADAILMDYRLTAQVFDVPACGAGAWEPNDTGPTAAPLTAGVTQVGVLCPDNRLDYWRVTQPAGMDLTVSAVHVVAGTVLPGFSLMDEASGAQLGSAGSNPRTVSAAAADRVVLVEFYAGIADPPAVYGVRFETAQGTPPPVCADPGPEPNNTLAAATPLPGATYQGVACTPQDQDFFSFTTGASGVIEVSLAMPTGVDLDLRLFDAAGTLLVSGVTALNPETITTTAPSGQYVLQVMPYTASALPYPAPYTLNVSASDLVLPTSGSSGAASSGASSASPSSGVVPSSAGSSFSGAGSGSTSSLQGTSASGSASN